MKSSRGTLNGARGERRHGGTQAGGKERERQRENYFSRARDKQEIKKKSIWQKKTTAKKIIETCATEFREVFFFLVCAWSVLVSCDGQQVAAECWCSGSRWEQVGAWLPCVAFLSLSSLVWLLGRILISGGSGLWPTRDAIRAFRYWRRVTCRPQRTSMKHKHGSGRAREAPQTACCVWLWLTAKVIYWCNSLRLSITQLLSLKYSTLRKKNLKCAGQKFSNWTSFSKCGHRIQLESTRVVRLMSVN